MVLCTLLTYWTLRTQFNKASDKTRKEASRQINYVLITQAIVPFVFTILPIAWSMVPAWFNVTTSFPIELTFIFYNWTPAINGIVTMLIIRPYRRALFGCFGKVFGVPTANIPTIPVSNTTTSVAPMRESQ